MSLWPTTVTEKPDAFPLTLLWKLVWKFEPILCIKIVSLSFMPFSHKWMPTCEKALFYKVVIFSVTYCYSGWTSTYILNAIKNIHSQESNYQKSFYPFLPIVSVWQYYLLAFVCTIIVITVDYLLCKHVFCVHSILIRLKFYLLQNLKY